MKKYTNITGFTLVEVLVSMTILAIVMVSIMGIYGASADISLKTDINREMQQNIKSIVETIAEDVRLHGIVGVSNSYPNDYNFGSTSGFKNGTKLKVGNNGEYKLYGYKSGLGEKLNDKVIVDNTFCNDIKNTCLIFKEGIGPLTNSKISILDLNFYVSKGSTSNPATPKLTISFTARAAIKNGLRPDIIKNSTLIFQTTISERNLQVK